MKKLSRKKKDPEKEKGPGKERGIKDLFLILIKKGVLKVGKFISFLFNLARKLTDFKAIISGDPGKMARRVKNKYIGKKIKRIW